SRYNQPFASDIFDVVGGLTYQLSYTTSPTARAWIQSYLQSAQSELAFEETMAQNPNFNINLGTTSSSIKMLTTDTSYLDYAGTTDKSGKFTPGWGNSRIGGYVWNNVL